MVKNLNIRVFCDDELVFEGQFAEWLKFNKDDEDYLLSICENLNSVNYVQFGEASGFWKVEKVV